MFGNKDNDNAYGYIQKADIFICILLCFSAMLVYWQVKDFAFTEQFDDPLYVTKNIAVLKGITGNSIERAFKFTEKGASTYWQPIALLSHMIDVSLFGLNPAGHHLMNLFFHVVNFLLLFIFLKRFTGHRWRSALVATLFAVHPLTVDSVAWIAERKSVLSTSFWFLGLILYGYYVAKPNKIRYLNVFFCMLIGLLTKPLLVTMPCLFLLLDLWPLKRVRLEASFPIKELMCLVYEKIPLFILSGVWVYLSSLSMSRLEIVIETETVGMGLRLANALISYVKYFYQVAWPFNLAVFYPYPEKMFPIWQIVGAFLILFTVSLLVVMSLRRKPWLSVGWFWYIGTLLPTIGIMQNGLWPAMADRWMYVPIIGILIIISWGGAELLAKWKRKTIVVIMSVLILLLVLAGRQQTSYWANSETLFQHTLNVTPDNVVVRQNLGLAQLEWGEPDEALEHFKIIADAKPNSPKSYIMIGDCYLDIERVDKAFAQFEKALELNPKSLGALVGIGRCYVADGKPDKAIILFEEAIEIKPDFEAAFFHMALAMEEKGSLPKAIEHYKKAIVLDKKYLEAYNNLALVFSRINKNEQAIISFTRAIEINNFFAEGHNNLGAVFEKTGQLEKAESHYRRAIYSDKDYAQAYNNLGALLLKKGMKIDEAIRNFDKALSIKPEYAEVHNNYGLVLERQGKIKDAIGHYKKALEIKPDSIEAHNNLGALFFSMKNYNKAVYHFREALDIDPERLDILHNLDVVIQKATNFETNNH